MRRPLQQWLLSSHVFILVLPLGALLATGALSSDLRTQARISMLDQGALASLLVAEHLDDDDAALDEVTAAAAAAAHASVVVLDRAGVVAASAGADAPAVEAGWPEVALALGGEQAWRVRDGTLTVTNPVRSGDEIIGVVLLAQAPRQAAEALRHMAPRLSAGLVAALLLTLAVSASAGLVQSRSLRALAATARRIADGDMTASPELDGPRASSIEEIHVLAEALAHMTERLQARLAYIHEFASNVSHEFKTPLSTLQGTLELLQDDAEMPPAQRARFYENARAELHRMATLVDGLLALAQAEERGERAPLDLQGLLEDVVARYPGATLRGQAGAVLADSRQIETVALNLLENAHRHGAPPVEVAAFREQGQAGFRVTDAGSGGISEANLARLFDRFFTTDRKHGTGLGLALVRTICRVHGGDVTAESTPGRTTFTVTLPRADA